MGNSLEILKKVSFSDLTNWSVQYLFDTSFSYNQKFNLVKIGDFLSRNKTPILIQDNIDYKRVTIKIKNGGIFLRDTVKGVYIGTKKQFIINEGQFLLSKIDARNGAFGVVPKEVDNGIITGNFWTFDVDYNIINPHFLSLIATTPEFIKFSENASNGTTNRHYLQEDLFLAQKIPLPSLEEQNRIVTNYNKKIKLANKQEEEAKQLETEIENYLFEVLGIEKLEEKKTKKGLQFVRFRDLYEWNILSSKIKFISSKYDTVSLEKDNSLYQSVFRGKSPKYDKNGQSNILNQKCNRWNKIDLQYSKTVNDNWYYSIDNIFFTKDGDILINSTGEGTIGRSSLITKKDEGLLYDSHILLLRLNKEKINPLFYVFLFNSKYGQLQVASIKSAQSTNQTELGVQNLKKIVSPLPPLKIQREIVNHISDLKQQIKDLQNQAKENRELAIKEFENEIFG